MLNNVEETQEVSINQIEYCVQYVDSYFCLCQDHTSNILNNSIILLLLSAISYFSTVSMSIIRWAWLLWQRIISE